MKLLGIIQWVGNYVSKSLERMRLLNPLGI
jgi:hypothetical protein